MWPQAASTQVLQALSGLKRLCVRLHGTRNELHRRQCMYMRGQADRCTCLSTVIATCLVSSV
jgi:hypothetical protein